MPPQLRLKHLAEQAVNAIRLTMSVDRGDEQVSVGELTQPRVTVVALEHRVADVRSQLIEE